MIPDSIRHLFKKIEHGVPEIRERAIEGLFSKLSHGLISVQDLACEDALHNSLLNYITKCGHENSTPQQPKALQLLSQMAEDNIGAERLQNCHAADRLLSWRHQVAIEHKECPFDMTVVDKVIENLYRIPPSMLEPEQCESTAETSIVHDESSIQSVVLTKKETVSPTPQISAEPGSMFDCFSLVYLPPPKQFTVKDLSILQTIDKNLQSPNPQSLTEVLHFIQYVLLRDFPVAGFLHNPSILQTLLSITACSHLSSDVLCHAFRCIEELLVKTEAEVSYHQQPDLSLSISDGSLAVASQFTPPPYSVDRRPWSVVDLVTATLRCCVVHLTGLRAASKTLLLTACCRCVDRVVACLRVVCRPGWHVRCGGQNAECDRLLKCFVDLAQVANEIAEHVADSRINVGNTIADDSEINEEGKHASACLALGIKVSTFVQLLFLREADNEHGLFTINNDQLPAALLQLYFNAFMSPSLCEYYPDLLARVRPTLGLYQQYSAMLERFELRREQVRGCYKVVSLLPGLAAEHFSASNVISRVEELHLTTVDAANSIETLSKFVLWSVPCLEFVKDKRFITSAILYCAKCYSPVQQRLERSLPNDAHHTRLLTVSDTIVSIIDFMLTHPVAFIRHETFAQLCRHAVDEVLVDAELQPAECLAPCALFVDRRVFRRVCLAALDNRRDVLPILRRSLRLLVQKGQLLLPMSVWSKLTAVCQDNAVLLATIAIQDVVMFSPGTKNSTTSLEEGSRDNQNEKKAETLDFCAVVARFLVDSVPKTDLAGQIRMCWLLVSLSPPASSNTVSISSLHNVRTVGRQCLRDLLIEKDSPLSVDQCVNMSPEAIAGSLQPLTGDGPFRRLPLCRQPMMSIPKAISTNDSRSEAEFDTQRQKLESLMSGLKEYEDEESERGCVIGQAEMRAKYIDQIATSLDSVVFSTAQFASQPSYVGNVMLFVDRFCRRGNLGVVIRLLKRQFTAGRTAQPVVVKACFSVLKTVILFSREHAESLACDISLLRFIMRVAVDHASYRDHTSVLIGLLSFYDYFKSDQLCSCTQLCFPSAVLHAVQPPLSIIECVNSNCSTANLDRHTPDVEVADKTRRSPQIQLAIRTLWNSLLLGSYKHLVRHIQRLSDDNGARSRVLPSMHPEMRLSARDVAFLLNTNCQLVAKCALSTFDPVVATSHEAVQQGCVAGRLAHVMQLGGGDMSFVRQLGWVDYIKRFLKIHPSTDADFALFVDVCQFARLLLTQCGNASSFGVVTGLTDLVDFLLGDIHGSAVLSVATKPRNDIPLAAKLSSLQLIKQITHTLVLYAEGEPRGNEDITFVIDELKNNSERLLLLFLNMIMDKNNDSGKHYDHDSTSYGQFYSLVRRSGHDWRLVHTVCGLCRTLSHFYLTTTHDNCSRLVSLLSDAITEYKSRLETSAIVSKAAGESGDGADDTVRDDPRGVHLVSCSTDHCGRFVLRSLAQIFANVCINVPDRSYVGCIFPDIPGIHPLCATNRPQPSPSGDRHDLELARYASNCTLSIMLLMNDPFVRASAYECCASLMRHNDETVLFRMAVGIRMICNSGSHSDDEFTGEELIRRMVQQVCDREDPAFLRRVALRCFCRALKVLYRLNTEDISLAKQQSRDFRLCRRLFCDTADGSLDLAFLRSRLFEFKYFTALLQPIVACDWSNDTLDSLPVDLTLAYAESARALTVLIGAPCVEILACSQPIGQLHDITQALVRRFFSDECVFRERITKENILPFTRLLAAFLRIFSSFGVYGDDGVDSLAMIRFIAWKSCSRAIKCMLINPMDLSECDDNILVNFSDFIEAINTMMCVLLRHGEALFIGATDSTAKQFLAKLTRGVTTKWHSQLLRYLAVNLSLVERLRGSKSSRVGASSRQSGAGSRASATYSIIAPNSHLSAPRSALSSLKISIAGLLSSLASFVQSSRHVNKDLDHYVALDCQPQHRILIEECMERLAGPETFKVFGKQHGVKDDEKFSLISSLSALVAISSGAKDVFVSETFILYQDRFSDAFITLTSDILMSQEARKMSDDQAKVLRSYLLLLNCLCCNAPSAVERLVASPPMQMSKLTSNSNSIKRITCCVGLLFPKLVEQLSSPHVDEPCRASAHMVLLNVLNFAQSLCCSALGVGLFCQVTRPKTFLLNTSLATAQANNGGSLLHQLLAVLSDDWLAPSQSVVKRRLVAQAVRTIGNALCVAGDDSAANDSQGHRGSQCRTIVCKSDILTTYKPFPSLSVHTQLHQNLMAPLHCRVWLHFVLCLSSTKPGQESLLALFKDVAPILRALVSNLAHKQALSQPLSASQNNTAPSSTLALLSQKQSSRAALIIVRNLMHHAVWRNALVAHDGEAALLAALLACCRGTADADGGPFSPDEPLLAASALHAYAFSNSKARAELAALDGARTLQLAEKRFEETVTVSPELEEARARIAEHIHNCLKTLTV